MTLLEALHLSIQFRRNGAILEVNAETITRLAMALRVLGLELETITSPVTARPRSEWHEDMGPMLWWRFPVEEPPFAGTPLDEDFPEGCTHFTEIEVPPFPKDTLN